MKKWLPIIILALAQFIMVLDSTVMNVSLSEIVKDLDTTVATLQVAITLYTLTMAALMLVGAKLGDIWGRKRAFAIGLVVYGVGSLTTALSPNVTVLLIGWSIVEGLGAVLVVPAIVALTATNYEGRDRAMAFGMIGGIAGAAAAAGPLIGGFFTTYLSWRWVFGLETVAVLAIISFLGVVRAAPKAERKVSLDGVGALLSASGLVIVVLAIVQTSRWGWVVPKSAPVVAGHEITPFGLSVVPFMILAGLVVLGLFGAWEKRRETHGREPLLAPGLVRRQPLRSGLTMVGMQQLIIAGTFFVLPVYLQMTLERDALQTGVILLPLAVGVMVFALLGPRFGRSRSPRRIVQGGLVLMLFGAFLLMVTISPTLKSVGFAVALGLLGSGVGLMASQLGNVNLSAVGPERSSEVGGAQGVFQNLGASLGTALIGAILLSGLTSAFYTSVRASDTLPAPLVQQITTATKGGVEVVSLSQVKALGDAAGLPADQTDQVVSLYEDSQLQALKKSMLGVAFLVVLGFWFARRLPNRPLTGAEAPAGP